MSRANVGGGRWVVAGTPLDQPYPCRCDERRGETCSPRWCPCSGRVDLTNVPTDCCARWNTPKMFAEAWRKPAE